MICYLLNYARNVSALFFDKLKLHLKLNTERMELLMRNVTLICTCLLFGALLWLASHGAASAEPGKTLLDEDFNAMTPGLAPTGWNLDNLTGGAAVVEAFPVGSDRSFKLTDTSATNPVIVSKSINGGTGLITVEFDIYPAQTGAYLVCSTPLAIDRFAFTSTTRQMRFKCSTDHPSRSSNRIPPIRGTI
ncbi:hypothetical protein [Paenibacillus eucommiae]|uniref:Uncharacterized protein n=1 Tax=Paenibacillus eucommiae TaxID=1355755 RepID=A0ABS4IRP4_9BACL|nr:hypothetical protein [Paenibacillus eucommiae]MBP1990244.1 hypothetical protein [Paenibacillus eucommiae]